MEGQRKYKIEKDRDQEVKGLEIYGGKDRERDLKRLTEIGRTLEIYGERYNEKEITECSPWRAGFLVAGSHLNVQSDRLHYLIRGMTGYAE